MKKRDEVDAEAMTGNSSRNRLSLPLTDEGVIDWEHVRPSTRQKFADIVSNDPDALEAIGLSATQDGTEEGADIFEGVTEENVRVGLDIISQANALIFNAFAPKVLKHPFKKINGKPAPFMFNPELLKDCFTLTAEQHEELDPRALKLAQKHGNVLPEWFKKHMDVYMLVFMYLRYTAENAKRAITEQLRADIQAAQAQNAKQAAQRPIDSDARPTNGRTESFTESPPPPQPINITEAPERP